jgi:DHA2 family multidrug resistance protein
MFGVALGANLQTLDTTMAAVALTRMQGALSASHHEITWVLTAYLIGVAIVMPLIGILINRFGRKHLYLTALVGFSAAAMGAGMSDSLIELVLFRFLQGLFSATFVPVAQSFIFDAFRAEEQGQAIGLLALGTMSGTMIGPALGGYVSEFHSWRWIFYLDVPIAILSFAIIHRLAPKRLERPPVQPLGLFGFMILTVGLVALQFVLSRGGQMDWFASSGIITAAGLVVVTFYLFAVHTAISTRPFIDPDIFKNRNFSIGLVLILFLGAHWLVYLTLLSPYLQTLADYSVISTGLALVPQGAAYAAGSYVAGHLCNRFNPSHLVIAGFCAVGWANWQMSFFTPNFSQDVFYLVAVIHGLGLGFIFVPLTITTFSTLPTRHKDVGTGLFSLLRNFGSSLGASLAVTHLVRQIQSNHAALGTYVTPYNEAMRHVSLPKGWNLGDPSGLANLDLEVTRQAVILAYASDFRWLAASTGIAIVAALFVRMPRRLGAAIIEETSTGNGSSNVLHLPQRAYQSESAKTIRFGMIRSSTSSRRG